MKKAITTILLTLFLASMLSMAFVAPVAATPDSGIVGLWHFDEGTGSTAQDSSGNDNDGTLSGGKFGNALYFDGTGDYLSVDHDGSLSLTGAFTVEAWVYRDSSSLGSLSYVLSKDDGLGDAESNYNLLFWSDNKLALFLQGLSPTGTETKGTDYWNGGGGGIIGETSVLDDGWHHVAGVYTGSALKVYVDGVVDGEVPVSGIPHTNTAELWIGNRKYNTVSFFEGLIDEVRISNNARYTGALFTVQSAPFSKDANTMGLWHIDESTGSTVEDASDYLNDGTFVGDPEWAGPTWTTEGVFDAALEFDGTDDYVEVPYSTSLDITGEITIEAWVHAKGTGTMLKIACKRETQVPFYFIGVDRGKLYAGIGDDTSYVVTDKVTDLPLSEWHHVAMAYSDAENKIWLYLDGELEETKDCEISLPTFTAKLLIGAQYYNNQYMQFFNGIIDEVRIWNRVLTAEETKKHAWGLVGEWDFNEGSGTTAYDTSGFGNDGTLNNFASPHGWVDGRFGKALSFDGVNDYVEIQHSANLDITDAISVEAWIKADLVGGTIIRKGAWPIVEPPPTWGFDIQNSKLRAFIYDDGTPYIAYGTTTLVAGGWYHVAFTYDGEDIRIYLNGVEDGSQHHSGDIDPTDAPIWISRKDQVNYFDGIIDEVRVWNKALIPVKFAQTGLDSSATGTVVTVDDPIVLGYNDLPYIMMVESGITVAYEYEDIVLSGTPGKRFKLDTVIGPLSPIIVTGPVTVTGNYKVLVDVGINIDPDTLNLKSNGQWITAYITLPEGYGVEDIDAVYLEDGEAAWSEIQDGVFMAKFDRLAVQGAIKDVEGYEEGTKLQEVTLTVTGQFFSGDLFQGSDTVRVITK